MNFDFCFKINVWKKPLYGQKIIKKAELAIVFIQNNVLKIIIQNLVFKMFQKVVPKEQKFAQNSVYPFVRKFA